MRTKLADYCQQFTLHLEPLHAPLERARDALESSNQGTPGRELLPALAAAQHDVRALLEKVRGQEAYVLIFGPLKSGKSTLMNAVAQAYVSEVSSLPAYPCLVFVGAGDRREYRVTRYDGSTATAADAQALTSTIDAAHQALALALRSAETQQQAFDPEAHLPTAIRRIDVRLPAAELASRGAVLVDTPGLYTRMRFGYDRLTRDFRDTAACAVFVVKSDTLFLEQVFAEFDDLLDLFSRIFLVVNVDSHKLDVDATGRLVPSLEQSQPDAILQAFRRLAMPAALHRAATEGRLRMFAVDLLAAAAAGLQHTAAPADFAAFSTELHTFLGSDEYLAAFVRDSLRRGQRAADAIAAALADATARALFAHVDDLQQRLEFTQAEIDLLRRALERDFAPAFARAERTLADELERTARDDGHTLLRALGASIDTWFLSGHSLHWLLHDTWRPLLQDHRNTVAAAARRALEQVGAQPDAGLDLPAAIVDLCDRRDLDVRALRRAELARIGEPDPHAVPTVPVAVAAIPLKRGLFDLVAFRSLDAVRRRVFGPAERPDARIPQRDKQARLGEPGRLHLHQCVVQLRATLAPKLCAELQRHFGVALRDATIRALQARLREELAPLLDAEARLQRELQRLRAVQAPLQELAAAATTLRQHLGELSAACGEAAAPERAVVLEPARRRAPADDPALRERG